MKYTIRRKTSLNKEKYEILCDSKKLCSSKIIPSEQGQGQYNIELSKRINKHIGENSCLIQPDPKQSHGYLIYLKNDKTKERQLFGRLHYEYLRYNNSLYTIIIGRKLYQVRSCDLKDRRLTIVDTTKSNGLSSSPQTLFQVVDLFSKATKTYHAIINDKESEYGYLAIIVLLDILECKRNSI